eukprot:TRINITY_DN983_c0_g2_i1.p1 TRINITY_DN983_c0_g2~~TRINITY_DN983_c0_g2_i1.p1  ORF type:complete len:738 (+),score=161.75 TRINITY_DN983_c0_g2_i1:65-2278(+)
MCIRDSINAEYGATRRTHMQPPHSNTDLGLSRQSSEHLRTMLEQAITAIDEQKPAALAEVPFVPLGASVPQMIQLLMRMRGTAEMVSGVIRNRIVADKVDAWRCSARRANFPAIFFDLALAAFEQGDEHFQNSLTPSQALKAWLELTNSLHSVFVEAFDGWECSQAPSFEDRVTFRQFLNQMAGLRWPPALLSAVDTAANGLRCVCGHWMTEKPRQECYPGGNVRCDFTGTSVQAEMVWHCQRNRAEGIHPFGFDVAGESTEAFRDFQMTARLHDRLKSAVVETECTQLEEQLAACIQVLMPTVTNMFLSIKDDVSNSKAAGRDVQKLEERYQWCRSILESAEWGENREAARLQMQRVVDELEEFSNLLSHDKLHFKDPAHRALEIQRFEHEFAPADRHAKFDVASKKFASVCALAKEFLGCEQFEEDDAAQQLVSAFGEQILNAIMAQRGLLFIARSVESSFEQTEAGVKFKWTVAVAPAGQQIRVEHVAPIDKADIDNANMHRQFMGRYHEIQDRIKALVDCATEGDLQSQLTEFEIGDGDASMGELCVICQEDMVPGEQALQINSCQHCFHNQCVRGWLLGCKHECPICKAPVMEQTGGNQTQQESVEEPSDELGIGTRVMIQGLVSRSELNGIEGTITRFDQTTGRYAIQTGNLSILLVRRRNVSVIQHDDEDPQDTEDVETDVANAGIVDSRTANLETQEELHDTMQEEAMLEAALALSMQMEDDITRVQNQ